MTLPLMAVAISLPLHQSLRASGLCERGNRLDTTSVIARRAKPDEAIAFKLFAFLGFEESSKGVFTPLRLKAIAVYSLKWGKFEGGLSTPSN